MTRRLRENPNPPVRQAAALIPPAFAEGGPTAGKAPLCQNCALACGASTFLPVSVVITIEGANVAAPRWRRVARYETYSNNERITAAPTPQGRTNHENSELPDASGYIRSRPSATSIDQRRAALAAARRRRLSGLLRRLPGRQLHQAARLYDGDGRRFRSATSAKRRSKCPPIWTSASPH